MQTSVKAVRDVLPAGSRDRSTAAGAFFFVVAANAYLATFAATIMPASLLVRALLAPVAGLAIGMLFIVGHDACHGSLTPSTKLNAWLGRVAFLPSLHPFAAWEYSHN